MLSNAHGSKLVPCMATASRERWDPPRLCQIPRLPQARGRVAAALFYCHTPILDPQILRVGFASRPRLLLRWRPSERCRSRGSSARPTAGCGPRAAAFPSRKGLVEDHAKARDGSRGWLLPPLSAFQRNAPSLRFISSLLFAAPRSRLPTMAPLTLSGSSAWLHR